jgi:hypothetical protein
LNTRKTAPCGEGLPSCSSEASSHLLKTAWIIS